MKAMNDMTDKQSAWSVPVAVEDIPETGLHVEIEANDAACAALAQTAGLRDLSDLAAAFDLAKEGARVRVSGRVSARVGQTCVVTLEPLENKIEESIDLVFARPAGAEAQKAQETKKGEPPEPLTGDVIDLGAVASEFLMLGIDPYPRKQGAQFTAPAADDAGAHPFAALAALKKPPASRK